MSVEVTRNHFMCRQILCHVSTGLAGGQGSDGRMSPSHEVERDHAVALGAW